MRTSLKRIAVTMTSIATVGSMLLSGLPAHAATPTLMKDTLTRLKISVSAAHVVSMTLPGSGILPATTGALEITYTGFGTLTTTPDVVCGTGTATASLATTVLTITSGGTPCSGTLVVGGVTPFTATNPGTSGSKEITMTGNAANLASASPITGSFAISIVDDDQVTVTATVAPSITFDLDTATTDTESATPYSVPLGTLTTGAVASSSGSINSIWMDLSTNATGGAVVTVKNANGANGLASASVPADDIDNLAAAMAAGTENYGLCVISVADTVGDLAKAGDYTSGTCANASATNDVENLTTTPAAIINTTGAPVSGGRARVSVNAAISGVTTAHNNYTDTLTFVATGTF